MTDTQNASILGLLRIIDTGHSPLTNNKAIRISHELFPIMQSTITLGSGIHNSIALFGDSIADKHIILTLSHNIWTIINVAGNQTVLVEDYPLATGESIPIEIGEKVHIGAIQLQLITVPRIHQQPVSFVNQLLLQTRMPIRSILRNWRWFGIIGIIMIMGIIFSLIVDGAGYILTHRALTDTTNIIFALTIPLIPVLGILILVAFIDRHERQPWYLQISAFLWGMIFAIPTAQLIESRVQMGIDSLSLENWPRIWADLALSGLSSLNAGITEEIAKGIALVVLANIFRRHLRTMADGILYGAIIGAGFGLIENMINFARAQSNSTLISLIVGRIILGWLGHSTFTACIGAAIGYRNEHGEPLTPWRKPLLGFLIAICLHAFFDFTTIEANAILLYAVSFVSIILVIALITLGYVSLFIAEGVLFLILIRSLNRENRFLIDALALEVHNGAVLPEELLVLQQASLIQRVFRSFLIVYDIRLWQTVRQLYAAEIRLAVEVYLSVLYPSDKEYKNMCDFLRQQIHLYRWQIQTYEERLTKSGIAIGR